MVYWAGVKTGIRERMYDDLNKTRKAIVNYVDLTQGKNRSIPIYKSKDAVRPTGVIIFWHGSFYWMSNVITSKSDYRYYILNKNGSLGNRVSIRTARALEEMW